MSFMRAIVFSFLMVNIGFAEEWAPPEKPDVNATRKEAVEDWENGRFDLSLQKFVWYHENAEKFGIGQGGVRLSFSLSEWVRLAKMYPPAMAKLRQIRDQNLEKVLSDPNFDFKAFHDAASINRELGENGKTIETFKQLDINNPEAAKRAYIVADTYLIEAKEYALCGKYVEPIKDFENILRLYQLSQRTQKNRAIDEQLKKLFRNQTATLIALLVICERKEEAEVVAGMARDAWDDAEYFKAINKALAGEMPKPR